MIILKQVFILFAFIAIGYILSKKEIIDSKQSVMLSKLLIYVFLPCNIFKTFAKNCTLNYLSNNYTLIIYSFVIMLVIAVSAHFLSKLFSNNAYTCHIFEYSLIVPNFGYMGYSLAESIMGQVGLTNIIVFALPVSFYTYTIGFCMLTKRGLSLKSLINPVMIAIVLGMIVGILKISVPDVATEILNKSSSCMAPISMILTGMVISQFDIKPLVSIKKYYVVVLLRLIIIPTFIGVVLTLLKTDMKIISIAVLMYSMPCGLNTIAFPKAINENCEIGAGLALISNILACVTIPIVLFVFDVC